MSDLEQFWFEDSGDRWEVRFVGTSDAPEWVANDVVNVLYPASVRNEDESKYLAKVPIEWKGRKSVPTLDVLTLELVTKTLELLCLVVVVGRMQGRSLLGLRVEILAKLR